MHHANRIRKNYLIEFSIRFHYFSGMRTCLLKGGDNVMIVPCAAALGLCYRAGPDLSRT